MNEITNNQIPITKSMRLNIVYWNLRFVCILYLGYCIFHNALNPGIATAQEWQVVKDEHFLVYYLEDKNFAKEIARVAERYYDKIASDLGYSRYDKFWQWENRAKIYIYMTREQFIIGAGVPRNWAAGLARYHKKEIISFRWNEGFLEELLPHELTHLIFRDFVGFPAGGEGIPLWIDEGVAQWEERSKKAKAEKIVREIIKKGDYIPIEKLTRLDVRRENDFNLARNFYAQAITLVGYLIDKHGGKNFTFFCRELRDGKTLDEALFSVYKSSISNLKELEKKWLKNYGG